MTQTIDILRQDHLNAAKLLDAFERQIGIFDQGESPDYEIIGGIVDYCLNYPDLYHHPLEDLVLTRLQSRNPAAAEKIGDLLKEHENLSEITRRLAAAVNSVLAEVEVPRDAFHKVAQDFLDFYRKHIAKEEADFFPSALNSLTAEDWTAIEAETTRKPDPVFGSGSDKDYAALRKNILAWDHQD